MEKENAKLTEQLNLLQNSLDRQLKNKTNLLHQLIPDTDVMVIAVSPIWQQDIPELIPRECIVDIDVCMNNAWREKNQGKILYLHRQSFGTTAEFEETLYICSSKYIPTVEINATSSIEWLREIIRKEIR